MATPRLAQFERDVLRARDLVGLGQSYQAITHGVVDSSDILRASLVQAIAALDHYFHGVVLDRAVDILLGRVAPGTNAKVGVPFHAVQEILAAPTVADREQTARMHVAQRLGLETFQRSDAIGSALSMVGVAKVWTTAFPLPTTSPAKQLDLIVARRNRIVHQGDSDPVSLGAPTPISAADALDAVSTVETVVRTIDPLC
jgi:hypothetical protein